MERVPQIANHSCGGFRFDSGYCDFTSTSWNEEIAEDIADDLHFKEGFTEQVMKYLVSRSLLTMSTLASSVTIITSPGIQRRYQEAKKGAKRQIEVDSEIWLLSEEETASCIKVTKNPYNSEKNPSFSEKNESNSEKNHTKESKVKERYMPGAGTTGIRAAGNFPYPKQTN